MKPEAKNANWNVIVEKTVIKQVKVAAPDSAEAMDLALEVVPGAERVRAVSFIEVDGWEQPVADFTNTEDSLPI